MPHPRQVPLSEERVPIHDPPALQGLGDHRMQHTSTLHELLVAVDCEARFTLSGRHGGDRKEVRAPQRGAPRCDEPSAARARRGGDVGKGNARKDGAEYVCRKHGRVRHAPAVVDQFNKVTQRCTVRITGTDEPEDGCTSADAEVKTLTVAAQRTERGSMTK